MGSRMPPFLLWSLLFLEAGNLLSVSLEQKYLVQPCWRYLKKKKKKKKKYEHSFKEIVSCEFTAAACHEHTLFVPVWEKKHKGKNWQTQFQSHDPVKFFTYFPPCLLQYFFPSSKKKNLLSVHSSFCLYDILQAMRNIRHFPIVIPKQ